MSDTWIPAYRKLFDPDHHLSLGRPCCPRFAWLDLCQMATREARTVSYGHELIELRPGELVASVRTLAERWKWSKSAVSRFLGTLEKRDSLCNVRGTPAGTVYLIVNKELYWLGWDSERDSTRTASGTGEGQDADKNKKKEKREKEENNKKPSAKKRASQLPESWKPNSHHSELARSRGVNVGEQAAMFKDHHLAKGSTFVDWDRAFNTWLRRAKQYERPTPPSPGSQAAQVRNEKPRQEGERTGKLTLVGKDQTEQEERRAKIDAWKKENAEKLDELRDTAVREMELALTAFGRKPEVAQRLVETKVDEMIWNQKLQGAA